MNKKLLMLICLSISMLFSTQAHSADPAPTVTGFAYTGEKAFVAFSDGTSKTFVAADMGIREYDVFCKNLSIGTEEPQIIIPSRYIVVRTKAVGSDPAVTTDTRIEGVAPTGELESVKAESTVVKP